MARKKRLSTSQKVREIVRILGGKKPTIREMKAASASSLKRWMNRECQPIQAHVHLIDDTHKKTAMLKKVLKGTLKNFSPKNRKEFYAFFHQLKNRLK